MEETDLTWRTSTYSSNGGGECVEVANRVGAICVRDTTNRIGGTLVFGTDAWEKFTATLR